MRKLTLILSALFLSYFSVAQKHPSNHLFLFDLTQNGDTYKVSNPKWLNQFNPNGYNNQPHFVSEDEVYISAQFPWDTTQTDIYSLNITTKEFFAITNTPESEYSPKRMPNGTEFSVVRVDANADKTQRLWRYPLNRSNKGAEVFKYYQSVGYYHWCSPEQAMMFMVDKPKNYIQLTKVGSENTTKFTYEPGRCFAATPNNRIAYIEKTNEDDWFIKTIDPNNLDSDTVVKTLNQSEDFVILQDGTYLMGKGSELYQFRPKKDSDWTQIADLRTYNIKKIERMAVNKSGKLILVTK